MGSWFDFASEIVSSAGIRAEVISVSAKTFGQFAKRSAFSVIENYTLRLENMDIMPHWKDALCDYLRGDIR